MRFLHLADLHLGKRLRDISFLEDQADILRQITHYAKRYAVDCVLIAGDIYQSTNPSAEAMALLDDFLGKLRQMQIKVFMISGNHDSEARIAYLSHLIREAGVYTSTAFTGTLQQITMEDEHGEYVISLLPFCKPVHVRMHYPDADILTYEDAIACVMQHSPIDTEKRNLLLCHQCIAGCSVCDSEMHAVGGLDTVSAELFSAFDYVALGHLHQGQQVLRPTIRYAGSPLKYSVSECDHKKSIPLVEFGKKGEISVELLPLTPLHDMRCVEGKLEDVLQMLYSEDYIQVTLTDDMVPPDAVTRLHTVFPNMLHMRIMNSRTDDDRTVFTEERTDAFNAESLFCEFYALQNNDKQPPKAQLELLQSYIKQLWEETP